MKKIVFAFALLMSLLPTISFAQNTEGNEDVAIPDAPLLNSMQLQREKWYYSLEEASANPEQVYKLSLKGKKLKEIPKEVFYFTNLQELDLSENKIKEVPAEIGNMKRLQYLNLFSNRIKLLPPEMQELGNLHTLYVASNFMTEVPAWVGGMGKLRIFNFAYNRITRLEAERVQAALPKCKVDHGFDR